MMSLIKKVAKSLFHEGTYVQIRNYYKFAFSVIYSFIIDFTDYIFARRKLFVKENRRYIWFQKRIISNNIDSIELKRSLDNALDTIKNKKVVRIAFIVYSSAEWQCEELYRLFERSNKFEPTILICKYSHGTKASISRTYAETCNFFEGNYNIKTYIGKSNAFISKDIDSYDILVYFNPYSDYKPERVNVVYRKMHQLIIYVPYGYDLQDADNMWSGIDYYGLLIWKVAWIHLCYTKNDVDIFSKKISNYSYNLLYSGFPKIDNLLKHNYRFRSNLWGICEKKIIWAPHFNLKDGMNGTFHENFEWFYKYAQKHKNISWIVRPHPRMEWGTLEYGVFSSSNEYLSYLRKWEALPNAKVIENGEYYDIFDSSDAMITDCISFVAEYQFTDKPMLILLPEHPRPLNLLGEAIHEVQYKCRGNDYKYIESFIDLYIDEDPLKEQRKQVFRRELDTSEITKCSSSEYVYKHIVNQLFNTMSIED